MSQINYLPAATSDQSCGTKAVRPRIGQRRLVFAPASGSVLTDLLAPVVAGQLPYAAGRVENKGCAHVQLTVSYLAGGDCDQCTVDTISVVTETIQVPGGTSYPLPDGLVSGISAQTGTYSDAGVFTASDTVKRTDLTWYSYYQPCCDPVLVP